MATKAKRGERGDSGKEPKFHQVTLTEWRKKPWEKPGSVRTSSPLANERTVYDYDSGTIIGQKSDWIGTFIILSSSIWLKSRQYGDGFVEDQCRWLSCRWGLHRGESSWHNLCWHFRDALWSCLGAGPPSDLDTAWIQLITVNLGISRKTKISVDAVLLMM